MTVPLPDAGAAPNEVALSVVIPTHNRRASVIRLLERLRDQATAAEHGAGTTFEVIVVADGCSDGTPAEVQRSMDAAAWPFALTLHEQTPARGAGVARNVGAARARGRILVFVDDDIEPFPTMLAAHAAAHASLPPGESLVLVGAPVPVRASPATLHDIAAWGWWEQQFERMSAPGHRFTYDEIFTGILSMPAKLFQAVGGFDESLGDCHEDSELGLRLFRAGARGGFSRAAGGLHHELRDLSRLFPRKLAEGRADVRIAQRWPELTGYLRISWRRPAWHTLAGFVRFSAFRAPRAARFLTRAALPVLSWLSRWRLRHQWRLLHGGTLVQWYWLGVAAEVRSEASLAAQISGSGHGWSRWSDSMRWLSIDLAAGIERAEELIDRNRPDALRVRLGNREVGAIDPLPTAERLHGGHLRRLLATTLAQEVRTALALHAAVDRARSPGVSREEVSEAEGAPPGIAPQSPSAAAQERTPHLTVVIPAYNAEATLRKALDSLRAQTLGDWEAVVVDDGSTDATPEIVREYATMDRRFRLAQQPHAGLSAARNTGIRLATAPWLHFLDADDWIAPTAYERLTAPLARDPSLDAVHCGWARVTPEGRIIAELRCWQEGDLFAVFAARCAIAVHACLVRRSVVVDAGGFDDDYGIAQDWVLWQRIARRGARFGRIDEVLAFHAFRPDALSNDPLPLLREGLRCIALGHGSDPGVTGAVHASGRPAHESAAAQLQLVAWVAGMLIGRGEEGVSLLQTVTPARTPPPPISIAEALVNAVPHSLGVTHGVWAKLWHTLLPGLEAFLAAVESQVEMTGYARGVRVAMERAIVPHVTDLPVTLGLHHVDSCECTETFLDRVAPDGCERMALHVRACGQSLGVVELPVIDGMVRASVLRDAIAATFAWPILGRFFETTQYRDVTFHHDGPTSSAWRSGVCVAWGLPRDDSTLRQALHDAAGWDAFVADVWSGAGGTAADGREDHQTPNAAHGWTTLEVSAPLADLPLANGVADVVVTVGGVAVAVLRLEGEGESIPALELPQRVTDAIGYELCRVVVREALIGRSWEGVHSLRDALRDALRERSSTSPSDAGVAPHEATLALAPGWQVELERRAGTMQPVTVLARRHGRFIGGSGDRTYAVGDAGRALLLQLERERGTPIIELGASAPRQVDESGEASRGVLYLPSLRWRRVGTPAQLRAIPRFGDERDEPVRDDLGDASRLSGRAGAARERLPILMYHHVSDAGASSRARWRVTRGALDEQLAALAERGYRCIRLAEWQRAIDHGQPLPHRPVLLTFDDGFADFAENAWPLVRRHGFAALSLIVTGSVGSYNTWDADAASEPLMDWGAIRALRDDGVEFGAHSVTHRRLTTLSPDDAFEEAARSRLQLEQELQLPVDTFAFPYGAEEPVSRHIVGAAGYQFGLSVRSGAARRNAPWLALPRIEVTGEDCVETLLAKLEE